MDICAKYFSFFFFFFQYLLWQQAPSSCEREDGKRSSSVTSESKISSDKEPITFFDMLSPWARSKSPLKSGLNKSTKAWSFHLQKACNDTYFTHTGTRYARLFKYFLSAALLMPDYGGVGERRMLAPKHMLNLEHVVFGEVWNQYVFNIFRKFGLARWKLLGPYWNISRWYKYCNKMNFSLLLKRKCFFTNSREQGSGSWGAAPIDMITPEKTMNYRSRKTSQK